MDRPPRGVEDLVAAGAAAAAADARSSRRWALTAERERATIAGALRELCGIVDEVELGLIGGSIVRGRVRGAAHDGAVLDRAGVRTVVRIDAVTSVSGSGRLGASDGSGSGDGVGTSIRVDETARGLADRGIEATFALVGGGAASGVVAWSGADHLVVRPANGSAIWQLVRIDAIVALSWRPGAEP
jgi:hypothetical protein